MNLLTLSSRVRHKESAIRFLQTHGIIYNQRLCCNGHEIHLSTSSDWWRCSYRQSRQKIGLRKGSWQEKIKLELRTVVLFVYCWSKPSTSIQFCHEELSISSHTVEYWNNFLSESLCMALVAYTHWCQGSRFPRWDRWNFDFSLQEPYWKSLT